MYMYVSMYVCVCEYVLCVCKSALANPVYVSVYVSMYVYVCMYVCVCKSGLVDPVAVQEVWTCMRVCEYVCLCVFMSDVCVCM